MNDPGDPNKETEPGTAADQGAPPDPDQPAATGDDAETPAGSGSHSEIEQLRREHKRVQDQLARSMADLANIRRRQGAELQRAREQALEGLASELLPVIDNFNLAMAVHEQGDAADADAMIEGLQMVRSLLEGVLERYGLKEIPAAGQSFDPNVHEAVGIDPQSDAEPGTVTRVLQTGYQLGDRVLRVSRVLVKAATEDAEDSRVE